MDSSEDPRAADDAGRFGRDDLRLLGRHLRDRRTSAGITLQRLSETSGVSIAAIRSLETGGSNPSLPTVIRVVEALGTTIDRALAAVRAARGRVVVTRAKDLGGPRLLSDGIAEAILHGETHVLPVKSVAPLPAAMARHASLCLVIDGKLLVSTDAGERVRLSAGDTYHAEPQAVRGWANAGSRPVRLLCIADTRIAKTPEGKEATA